MAKFVKVNDMHIVNLDHVLQVLIKENGDCVIYFVSGGSTEIHGDEAKAFIKLLTAF